MEDKHLINFNKTRPASPHSHNLPAFWVDKPVSWFGLAKSHFCLLGINKEQARYDYLISVLAREAVSIALDVLELPPEHQPK